MPGNQIDSFHIEIVRKYRGRLGLKTFVGMQYSPYQSDKYRQDHEGYMDVLEAFKSTYQSSASTISGVKQMIHFYIVVDCIISFMDISMSRLLLQ